MFSTNRLKQTVLFLTAGFLILGFSGCSTLGKNSNASRATGAAAAGGKGKSTTYYQDFADVLIPGEMVMEKKGTFVFQTPGLSAGVLALKGRVEANSLAAFFQSNMTKDNWRLVSSFRSTVPRSMLLYQKENRWCIISITEGDFNTSAEIWVSPTMGFGETGLLK